MPPSARPDAQLARAAATVKVPRVSASREAPTRLVRRPDLGSPRRARRALEFVAIMTVAASLALAVLLGTDGLSIARLRDATEPSSPPAKIATAPSTAPAAPPAPASPKTPNPASEAAALAPALAASALPVASEPAAAPRPRPAKRAQAGSSITAARGASARD
jgi:hypothetical protein